MDRLLIDVVLEQWKRQDESGVPRWAFFLCSKNKTPYYPKDHKFGNGHNSATTDEITAREMFGTATIKGSFIAVAGGELSGGVFVVDIDIKKEGTPELYKNPDNIESAIVNMFGDIPKTENQTTMSGGRHLLFYDKKINSLNDAFDVKSTGLSIDIKGNGGYFILYDDDINFENISDSPPWLLSHMNSRKTEQKESTADFSETLTEGNRNSGLTAIAGKFYNYGDSIDVLKSFLYGHNQLHCAPPLADKDVDRIIKSVIDNFSRDYEKTEFKNDENTENKSRFNLKNIHDIWRDRPPTKWIVDHLICEGSLSLIAADAGCGKTWASLDLASCIALGIPWLGMEVEQGNVLIIDEESGDDYLAKRFKQVITAHGGTEENTPAFYISMDRTSLVSINDLREIKKLIIENNINFIVIDAAMDVLPGVKENASDEVAPPLNSLKKIAHDTKCSFFVIHHKNKAGKDDAKTGFRGAGAFKGVPDLVIEIHRKKGSNILEFETIKIRNGAPLEFNAELLVTDFDFQLIKTDKKEQGKIKKQFSKTEIDIIIFLTNHPDSSPEDIQNSVKGTLKTIQNYLSPLKSKGFLTDKIDGKCKLWSISDEKHFEIKQIIDKGYYDEDEND